MVIYAIINGTEIGVKLNTEEVEAMGAGFVSLFSDPEMSKAYFDMLSKIGEAANEAAEKKDPDPEEDEDEEDEEEDADYEKERDRLIRELRDLGCEVRNVGDEDLESRVDVSTYGNVGDLKFTLIRLWLKDHGIKYDEGNSCTGRKVIKYSLTGSDLAALQQYLKDNEVVGSAAVL